MRQEILSDSFATLWYYPQEKIIHHKFHKFMYGEELKNLLTKGVEYFEQNNCKKWLSDDRENSATRSEDMKWIQEVWTPRVIKAGWKYWAIIMPEKMVGQMSMKRLVEQFGNMGVEVFVSSDPDEGFNWLKSK